MNKHLPNSLTDSEELGRWLDKSINGLAMPAEDRIRLAVGCLDMVLEHQKAYVTLVGHKLYGSAAALVGLVFEAYVRGIWLCLCATDKEIDNFRREKHRKNFDGMIADIEKLEPFGSGMLSNVKKKSWKTMNSFKHSGVYQVARRHKGSEIAPNYSDAEILDGLESVNAFAILTGIAIANIARDEALAREIYEQGKRFFGK